MNHANLDFDLDRAIALDDERDDLRERREQRHGPTKGRQDAAPSEQDSRE